MRNKNLCPTNNLLKELTKTLNLLNTQLCYPPISPISEELNNHREIQPNFRDNRDMEGSL